MPELPEVEVVRRGLHDHVVGRAISDVEVLHPRAVRRHEPGPEDFAAALAGRVVRAVRRRGKYLWLELVAPEDVPPEKVAPGDAAPRNSPPRNSPPGARVPDGAAEHIEHPVEDVEHGAGCDALLAHLGMSGQMLIQPRDVADEKHLRVRFRFADGGSQLRFVDQRTFGGFTLSGSVVVDGTVLPEPVAHIARDPLDALFDMTQAVRALRGKRTEVKRALLDQSLVSGVGNIYADEALWRSRLHGTRPTGKLRPAQCVRLFEAVIEVMTEALDAGGTSFDPLYVNVNGQSGYFDRSLAVYGRQDRPCPRCGSAIRREQFMNRSSYYCPRCQPRPRRSGPRGMGPAGAVTASGGRARSAPE